MRITKLGHCALLVEDGGARLLTDPGIFTADAQGGLDSIAVMLITHEHQDHLHVPSVRALIERNPHVVIVSNASVAALLAKEGIAADIRIIGDGERGEIAGFLIEGFGTQHAEIYEGFGQVTNTGYMLNGRLYYPGDAFHHPGRTVDVLALPVAGPWARAKEIVEFAKAVQAPRAFGVHDGMIVPSFRATIGRILAASVPGMQYVQLEDGETREF